MIRCTLQVVKLPEGCDPSTFVGEVSCFQKAVHECDLSEIAPSGTLAVGHQLAFIMGEWIAGALAQFSVPLHTEELAVSFAAGIRHVRQEKDTGE